MGDGQAIRFGANDIQHLGPTEKTTGDWHTEDSLALMQRRRVDARVKRPTRSRNAAIHGGTLSETACSTITDLARVLAQDALNTSIWSIVTRQQLETYAVGRSDEHRQRIANLKSGGDLANLFTLTP